MSETIFTLHEVAERLHMPYRSLRDAVYAGRWPHRKISQRKRLMTEADIQAVLALTAEQPAPTALPGPVEERRTKANVLQYLRS